MPAGLLSIGFGDRAGIKLKAARDLAGVSGVVNTGDCRRMTRNDTLNPMYGIAKAAKGLSTAPVQYGSLITLCVRIPPRPAVTRLAEDLIDATLTPTKIAVAADDTGLVSTAATLPTRTTLAALELQLAHQHRDQNSNRD